MHITMSFVELTNHILQDPAISANETEPYPAYDYGVETNVFMKNEDGSTLFGKVNVTKIFA